MEKMSLFLELISAHLCILITDKDIIILSEGTTQGLDDITKYPIKVTQPRKRFVLSLHYNGSNSFLFVNTTKTYQFKTRDFEMKDCALYFGNISKDFTINDMKKNFLLILILLTLTIF